MSQASSKKLLVIDGNALVHRAYHALPPLTTKKGELVNAVYGFLLVLFKALKDLKPDFVAACFDVPAPTFRHIQFKEYKAKRKKAPEELYQQINKVKDVLRVFNIPIYEKEGFEADDLIATIAVKAPEKQAVPALETIILSGDLDNLQLVNEKTKVYGLGRGIKETILYDTEKVREKYDGLLPSQLQDFRGLRGDPSDNIPGVTGIGEKTAIQLLKDFGTLENLYQEIKDNTEKAKKIKSGVLQKLKDYQEQATLSKQLAILRFDAPIDFSLKDCQFGKYEPDKISEALKNFEFYSLIERVPLSQKEIGTADREDIQKKQQSSFGFLSAVRKSEAGGEEKYKIILGQIEDLKKQGLLSEKIAQTEKSLVPIVQKMEENGIKVALANLSKLSDVLGKELEELEGKIEQQSGEKFNINSPQQLSGVLFQKLQISTQGLKKTPGGVVSTGAGELEKIKKAHPIVELILQYRELFKLKSGFVDSLPEYINLQTGRIHPHFHQLGTETGRLSCSEPNLQNIPVKGAWGKEIRECFVPEPGFLFLSADYSQMELRVVAALAEDEKMLGFFKQGKDIHKMTAAEIFEVPEKKVSRAQRDVAKTLGFGVLYGMGPHKFAENTGLSYHEAQEFIAKYFSEFQGIAQFIEATIEKTRNQGFSETLFGRKRFLPEINSRDARLRAQAERIARNLPGQGTAADIMKMAMVALNEQLSMSNNPLCRLLLQIHDELLFEVKSDKIKTVTLIIKEVMENIVQLQVPLGVETKIGDSWGEMKSVVK